MKKKEEDVQCTDGMKPKKRDRAADQDTDRNRSPQEEKWKVRWRDSENEKM